MSGADVVSFEGSVSVPAPLSVRLLRGPVDSSVSVIVDGPLGAVELQIRPALLELPGGGMSIEYHYRQPMPAAETGRQDCEVLGCAECYHDGITGGTQADFEPWFRTRDGQSIVDGLVRRYQATNDTAAIRISRPFNQLGS